MLLYPSYCHEAFILGVSEHAPMIHLQLPNFVHSDEAGVEVVMHAPLLWLQWMYPVFAAIRSCVNGGKCPFYV